MEPHQSTSGPEGTYLAAVFDDASNEKLKQLQRSLQLPITDDFHCTVIYSRHGFHYPEFQKFNAACRIKGFEIFNYANARDTDGKTKCLVALLETELLERLHYFIREAYSATHDFATYEPHVTLCTDYKGTMEGTLGVISKGLDSINIFLNTESIYCEPLKT